MKTVERHALWLRLVHWLNVPLMLLMIWSGLLIYWADDVYPGFFPQAFYELLHLDGRLAEGLSVHFFIAWFFVLNGLAYLTGLVTSGRWRGRGYSAAQRLAYTGVVGLGALVVLSGFAIYKPVQLAWLTTLFGGYRGARLVHFAAMLALSLFIFVHVVQVARAGWNVFRAMVAGFEVQDE